MSSITVIIYTLNEEKNISDCITSAKLLSNSLIVVDMQSQDKTIDIAKKLGADTYIFPKSLYVEPARKFGIEKAQSDWVFILDADERITKELATEIKGAILNPKFTHYQINRKNIFGTVKWLKYGEWWPDYQIRLINKNHFINWPNQIHSTPQVTGNKTQLNSPILHYFHGNFEKMVDKTLIFENIESDLLFKAQKKVTAVTFFRKFLGELYRRLFKKFGFLDGDIGITESIYQAFSKTITYLYLYEKSRSL